MFTALREFTRSWWFKGILGAIVLSFVLTFGYGGITSISREVAVIQGEEVSYEEYARTYENLFNFYSQLLENNPEQRDRFLDPDLLRNQAVEDLIKKKLLLIQAEKQGIRVSDGELAERIKSLFDRNGGFTIRRYERFLRSKKDSKKGFEENFRQSMILEKLESLIKDGVQVSDLEVREAYAWENEQVKIDYAVLPFSQFADQVEVQDQEISEYYEKSKKDFLRPARVKAEYILFNPQSYQTEVSASDQEIRAFYEEYADEYFRPHQVKASHILLRVENGADAEKESQIRKRSEEILEKARKGEEFAQLAKQFSEDSGTAPRGGDLGYFRKGQMVPPFEEMAFSLKKGEIGGPVRTNFGFHLIRVEDVQEAHQAPLKEVEEEIRQKIVQQKAQRMARKKAKRLYQAIVSEKEDFAQAAQKAGLTYETTDSFIRETLVISGIKSASAFANAAFSTPLHEVSEPVKTQEGYYLIKVAEKEAPTFQSLDEVKEEVRKNLIQKKSRELAAQKAQEIVEQVGKGSEWSSLVAELGLSIEHSDYFARRGGSLAAKGPSFIQTVFRLKEGEVGKVELPEGVYILKPVERKGINEEGFEKEKKEYRRKLLLQNREKTFQTWVTNLVQEAKKNGEVKINEERLL